MEQTCGDLVARSAESIDGAQEAPKRARAAMSASSAATPASSPASSTAWFATPSSVAAADESLCPTVVADTAAIVEALTAESGCGRVAAQSMCRAAVQQLMHMTETYLHRRGTPNSIPLETRLQLGETRDHHGGRRTLVYDRTEGNKFGLLFRLVLQHLEEKDYLPRCGQHIPDSATNPLRFHAVHAPRFARFRPEVENWDALPPAAQREYLHAYLFRLWTTDRTAETLLPEPGRRVPCRAKWGTFYISAAELDALCDEVMGSYHENEHFVA